MCICWVIIRAGQNSKNMQYSLTYMKTGAARYSEFVLKVRGLVLSSTARTFKTDTNRIETDRTKRDIRWQIIRFVTYPPISLHPMKWFAVCHSSLHHISKFRKKKILINCSRFADLYSKPFGGKGGGREKDVLLRILEWKWSESIVLHLCSMLTVFC